MPFYYTYFGFYFLVVDIVVPHQDKDTHSPKLLGILPVIGAELALCIN